MTSRRCVRRVLALAVIPALVPSPGSCADAPVPIELVAARGSRLADELARELRASGFAVVTVLASAGQGPPSRPLAPGTALEGAVVREDDGLITVYARLSSPGGPAEARAEPLRGPLQEPLRERFEVVDPRDRMARRRACLGVVESLRTLSRTSARTSAQTSAQISTPAPARVAGVEVEVRAASTAADADRMLPPASAAVPRAPPQREIGVGTVFGLASSPGGPTGHIQFLWLLPLGEWLTARVRGLWPVLGRQFRTVGEDVRTWTFGGDLGLYCHLRPGESRPRPFLGLALGPHLGLTERTPLDGLPSRETFTPSIHLGALAGIRFPAGAWAHGFLEVEVGRGWLIPTTPRSPDDASGANARAIQTSLGLLF